MKGRQEGSYLAYFSKELSLFVLLARFTIYGHLELANGGMLRLWS